MHLPRSSPVWTAPSLDTQNTLRCAEFSSTRIEVNSIIKYYLSHFSNGVTIPQEGYLPYHAVFFFLSQSPKMKYEIRELLALRGNGAIDQDKFSTQAIDSTYICKFFDE